MTTPVVLDEDTYTEAISFIIQRDFFPNLAKMKAQQKYFQAEQSGSFVDLQNASKTLQNLNRPKKEKDSNISVNYYFEEKQELQERVNLDLSLDQFQTLYTSEDNSSFTEILKKANQKAKENNKWFYDKESSQLRIAGSDAVRLVEGPMGWKYKAKNALMYYPEGESESWATNSTQAPSDVAASKGDVTPWSVRIGDPNAAAVGSPSLRGYDLVEATPTLNSQQVGTPQMTWGAIEGTPLLIEGSATPGPRFSLPKISRREQLGMKLSEKASRAYRKKTNERVAKGTPRPAMSGLMSPAAQHLLRKSQHSPHLQTNSFGNALRSAYNSSPLRLTSNLRRGTPTPIPLFRAGATPSGKNDKK
ncbi:hypothetical protein G6F56_001039 [Rhizopus delemar]|nr:hypothetical protein G6F56_001039 [Rhizopus delemar]